VQPAGILLLVPTTYFPSQVTVHYTVLLKISH